MVVRTNLNPAGSSIEHGLIASSMPKLEFIGSASEGLSEDLVPHTDTKNGDFSEERSEGLGGLHGLGGIAGPIGEEHTIGLMKEDFLERAGCRKQGDRAPTGSQFSEETHLDSKVERNDMKPRVS